MTTSDPNLDKRIDAAEKNLQRLIDWTERCDNKAAILLGVAISMTGVTLAAASQLEHWTKALYLLTPAALLPLVASLVFVYLVIWPRTKPPNDSLVFFGSIAKHDYHEYLGLFKEQNQAMYLDDLLMQCHVNAQVVTNKFARLKWAYRLLLMAVIPWGVALYLIL